MRQWRTLERMDNEAIEFWENRYQEKESIWSGNPNPVLVQLAESIPPGRVADLGAGEGADSIWFAEHGHQVDAFDISATALSRLSAHAVERGVETKITAYQQDLAQWQPEQIYNAVSAQFLQSPLPLPIGDILGNALRGLLVDGQLIIVAHGEMPPWAGHVADVKFDSPADYVAMIAATGVAHEVEIAELRERLVTRPDGEQLPIADAVVVIRRK